MNIRWMLTAEELEEALEGEDISPRNRVLVFLYMRTDMSTGELLGLKVRSVLRGGMLKAKLTIGRRTVTLSPPMLRAIGGLLHRLAGRGLGGLEAPLFPAQGKTGALSPVSFLKVVNDVLWRVGLLGEAYDRHALISGFTPDLSRLDEKAVCYPESPRGEVDQCADAAR